ncbi:MAG: hypothetical protein ACPKMZ_11105 [Pleomorphochaeta sp.]
MFLILLSISSSVFAFNVDEYTNYAIIGPGYNKGYVHFYQKDISYEGYSTIFSLELNKNIDKNHSITADYLFCNPTLKSEAEDLNYKFYNRSIFEFYIGVKNYYPLANNVKAFASYGAHINDISLEYTEELWLIFSLGVYANTGVKVQLNDDFSLELGAKGSFDFLSLVLTDYQATEGEYSDYFMG